MMEEVDPFVLIKWRHVFDVFFDINRDGILNWDDFRLLIDIVGKVRGEECDDYMEAKLTLTDVWHRIAIQVGKEFDQSVSFEEWADMIERERNGNVQEWLRLYEEYMFKLLDISDDALIDQSEYIEVMAIFSVGREEASNCFDKFARKDTGELVMAIDQKKFTDLWHEFLFSTDLNADGTYLFGFIG